MIRILTEALIIVKWTVDDSLILMNVRGSYQKFCTLTINFFIIHFTGHLSQQL